MRNIIKRVTTKSKAVATFLAISGFAISSLAIAMPVNARPDIVAALYQNPPTPQTEVRRENTDISRNQIILAINASPAVTAIAENILMTTSYDRIVTMNHTESLVCMVNGIGSVNGAVTCGFIDYE